MKLIITADWHIRATRPRCRVDNDWIETQRKALNQIVKISKEKKAPVMVVGDLFHSNSDVSFECIQMVQKMADELGELYILAGNHDLPYHSSENLDKSAIGVLLNSNNVHLIKDYLTKWNLEQEYPYIISAGNFDEEDDERAEIVFKHVLTILKDDKPDFVDCETPETLLEEFPNAEWIFTGDYHHNFHYEKNGRHVVNSGCLLRQASDFKDYQCGVYFVDMDKNIVEFVPIIDKEQFVDDTYILKQNEREERIERFVDKLNDTKNVSLDFVDNVKKAILQNKLDSDIVDTLNELLEV